MAPANLDATQCKMARAALGIGVRELAARAVVSPDTVSRLEKGERLHQRTVIAIREAMEAAGVEFLPDGGVRLRGSGDDLNHCRSLCGDANCPHAQFVKSYTL